MQQLVTVCVEWLLHVSIKGSAHLGIASICVKIPVCILNWKCFSWNSCREQTPFTVDQKITVETMEGLKICFVWILGHSATIAEQIDYLFDFFTQRIKETAGARRPLCFSLSAHRKINSGKAPVEGVLQERQTSRHCPRTLQTQSMERVKKQALHMQACGR